MSVHRIRLAGPWDYRWLSDDVHCSLGDFPRDIIPLEDATDRSGGSVKMPCDWTTLFGPRAGCASFKRKFHRPTNLESHERVAIQLTGVGGEGLIVLNGKTVLCFKEAKAVEVDVTESLRPFNTVDVLLRFVPEAEGKIGGLYDSVFLEIRSQ